MDLELLETGNGGDLNKKGNDLVVVFGFENMPYLGMFGGNKEAVTKPRIESQQSFDYWGNNLLMPNEPSIQFNSLTEKTLETVALNSAGRLLIEEAIKTDLAFMSPFAEITVTTTIISTDHLRIGIGLKQPDNLQEKQYIYIWDATSLTLLDSNYTPNTNVPIEEFLQFELNMYL